jgi:hypothetical protein
MKATTWHGCTTDKDLVVKRMCICELCGKPLEISLGECLNRGGRICSKCIPAFRLVERLQDKFADTAMYYGEIRDPKED